MGEAVADLKPSLKPCVECGELISSNSSTCIKCGAKRPWGRHCELCQGSIKQAEDALPGQVDGREEGWTYHETCFARFMSDFDAQMWALARNSSCPVCRYPIDYSKWLPWEERRRSEWRARLFIMYFPRDFRCTNCGESNPIRIGTADCYVCYLPIVTPIHRLKNIWDGSQNREVHDACIEMFHYARIARGFKEDESNDDFYAI